MTKNGTKATKIGKDRLGRHKKGELSIPDRKTLKGIMKGKSIAASMRDAGFSAKTANCKAGKKMKQLAPTFIELMEKHGITDDFLSETMLNGLKANKVISCNIVNIAKNGMKDADSMTKDFIDVEDHPTRHRFMDTALKVKGHMRDKDDVQPVTVIIQKW